MKSKFSKRFNMGGSGISVINRSEDKKSTADMKAIEEEKASSSTKTGSTALSSAAASQKDVGELQVDFELEDLPMEGADN